MYEHSAAYYDLIYRDLKDYGQEAANIHSSLKMLSSPPRRLLDVGCGTGEHAFRLTRDYGYQVDGVDIQPAFIDIARAKLPDARFEIADMRDFNLGQRYEAILCLFSSIGYVETFEGLQCTFASFARHLEIDGLLICEPWITPEAWTPGLIDVTSAADTVSGTSITRTREGSTDGPVSVLTIDYEIATPSGLKHLAETHRLGLFSRKQIEEALAQTGFNVDWQEQDSRIGRKFTAQLKRPKDRHP